MNFNFEQFERAKNIKIPSICEELAEDIGIQIGDGAIGFWRNSKGGRSYIVEMYGDIIEDESYLIRYVKPLKERLYGVHVSCHKNGSAGTITNRIYSKNLVLFYNSLGLPIGKKADIRIPRFILKNKRLQIACLKGLMDTDGSLAFSKGSNKIYSSPKIHFTTKSKPLAEQVCNVLDILGFSYTAEFDSKQHDYRTNKIYIKNNIYISGKKNLEKWMSLVGFHNIVQTSRYLVYKKIGYCLPKTTLQQRLEIIGK